MHMYDTTTMVIQYYSLRVFELRFYI